MTSSDPDSSYRGQAARLGQNRLSHLDIAALSADHLWAEGEPRLFRKIIRYIPSGIALIRPLDQVILYMNPALSHMLGLQPGEFVGHPLSALQAAEGGGPALWAAMEQAIDADGQWAGDIQLLRQDGSSFWCHSTIVRFEHQQHEPLWLSIHEDITARKQQEDALRESEARFRAIFYEDQSVKLLIDPEDGRIIDANPAALGFYGYSYAQITAMHIQAINQLPPAQVRRELENARTARRNYFNFRHRLASGEIRDVEVYSTALTIQQRSYLFSIIHDITERKRAEDELRFANDQLQAQMSELRDLQDQLRDMAIRDPLTRLYNRRYLHETLPRELARAGRGGYALAILMIDIDYFKQVNDTFGHLAGDEALQKVASTIMGSLRASDIACRYGGEEILCLLFDASESVALRRAEELRAAIAELQVIRSHPEARVTVSIGVALCPASSGIGEMILAADQALYRAKEAGRNCVCYAGERRRENG